MKQTCIRRIHRTWCASRYTESLDLEEPRSTAAISIAQAFVGWKTKHAAGAPGCRASGYGTARDHASHMFQHKRLHFHARDCRNHDLHIHVRSMARSRKHYDVLYVVRHVKTRSSSAEQPLFGKSQHPASSEGRFIQLSCM